MEYTKIKIMIFDKKNEINGFQVKQILLLSLVTFFLSGCGHPQNKVIFEGKNEVISNTNSYPPKDIPENRNSNSIENVEKNDGFLFKGENIDIIESSESNLEELPLVTRKNEFCFQEIDNKVKSKLNSFDFKGSTKYFRFVGQEKADSEEEKFTLKLTREQYAKINQELFKKFDSDASVLDLIELYYIRNNEYDYLLLAGHFRATSGMGHYYRHHTLFPLDSNRPVIEFDSLSSDPRKVRIDNSGTIYYTKIDSTYLGRIKDEDLNPSSLKEVISLFTSNATNEEKLKFNYDCKNWD